MNSSVPLECSFFRLGVRLRLGTSDAFGAKQVAHDANWTLPGIPCALCFGRRIFTNYEAVLEYGRSVGGHFWLRG